MKNLFLLFAFLLSWSLGIAQAFEGTVTLIPDFKTKADGKNKMVFYVQGDNVAMEGNGNIPMGGRMVGNRKTKEYYMLVDADGKKVALNINMDQISGMSRGTAPAAAQQEDHPVKPIIKETGATRVIDGYNCRQIISEMNGNKTEMWVTKDLDLSAGDILFGPNTHGQAKSYSGVQGMVLESWTTDASGHITSSFKMVPEKKTVDTKLFIIPEDYVKMDMMQLMQTMQGNPEMMQQVMEMFGGKK